jgi:hypothetical protein
LVIESLNGTIVDYVPAAVGGGVQVWPEKILAID